LLHLFGFVNDLSASLRCERAGKFFFVFGVAGLDVVIGNGIEEVALVIIHQVVNPTARGQSLVAVGVRRVGRLCGAPICLESLLDDLVAHESDVEPSARLVHGLGGVEVVVG
jgi:hypothetical protein